MSADKVIQEIFLSLKTVKWQDCDEDNNFQWYYAEDCHYVVNDKRMNAYWFVKAKSPIKAYESVKGKMANANS